MPEPRRYPAWGDPLDDPSLLTRRVASEGDRVSLAPLTPVGIEATAAGIANALRHMLVLLGHRDANPVFAKIENVEVSVSLDKGVVTVTIDHWL